MHEPVLPNFFVVGTGKAGTTSLFHYLKQHPQIYMSPVKEPSFFARELQLENFAEPRREQLRLQSRALLRQIESGLPLTPGGCLVSSWNDYQKLFRAATRQSARGEASVLYLWSKSAAANIRARIPQARIIMILRDPAERAFSQYLHQQAEGGVRASFRNHLQQGQFARGPEMTVWHPFLEIGLYCEQVRRYLGSFPRDRIKIFWYEEAWRDPAGFLQQVFEFLEVDPLFQLDLSRRSHERRGLRSASANYYLRKWGLWSALTAPIPQRWRPAARRLFFTTTRPTMTLADRRWLIDYYREDIQKLASLLDRDLSAWLR